ncbi:hypothetical protein BDN72DRAFT_758896 [Pluteus cervinus]|uniref:Uncharacterized protein n=1 Tax=Pluteus cervinus TaxID=181527 RepID=A0ACD3B9C0_9AGAR|nr:hypothetical protein BDN72DRAFT_758896 [Pluteus cervinus]
MAYQAPLHLYSLPQEVLETLVPRNLVAQHTPVSKPTDPQGLEVETSTGPRSCVLCLCSFSSVEEQRAHFRSDWHRYNVKARLKGGNPVTEQDFGELMDGLEDSLSGSASSDEDEGSNDSDTVNTLVKRVKRLNRSPSPSPEAGRGPQTALAWFHCPPSTQYGIYKAVLPSGTDSSDYISELRELQKRETHGRLWAIFMVAGGHFAGAVVRVSKPSVEEEEVKSKKPKKPKPEVEILKHKTFHRYTTRRKQGGSQSTNDNAKGNAKSAGAQLRRYGEQALRDDIRNLIGDWADDINMCERVWIRANTSNRRIFLDYEDSVLTKGDERLRTFPFPTRRPTQSEISRCLQELTRVKVSHFTEEELKEQDDAYIASLPKPRPVISQSQPAEVEKPKPKTISKEEEILREKWSRLLEMVTKGRLEPLTQFWEREGAELGGVDVRIPDWTGERRATLLQVASASGQEAVTQWLLEEARANPTIPVPDPKAGDVDFDEAGHGPDAEKSHPKGVRRAAYDLARIKGVRDVFRRCAGTHPDWWDWFGAGRVPSALSKEMEDGRDEKKKVRRKGLKDRVREREAKEREKDESYLEEEPNEPVVHPLLKQESRASQKLGGNSGSTNGIAGLTPEMRARVERERRARAAEARVKVG